MVVALAVLTHSAYDLAREFLDRLRTRRESAFRRQLRQLENQSSSEETLQIRMQEGLDMLCRTLKSTAGFIAIYRDGIYVVIATGESLPVNSQISPELVLCEDVSLPKNNQLQGIAWIAPAFDGPTQIAVIGLLERSGLKSLCQMVRHIQIFLLMSRVISTGESHLIAMK
jgi:hypothetical protein